MATTLEEDRLPPSPMRKDLEGNLSPGAEATADLKQLRHEPSRVSCFAWKHLSFYYPPPTMMGALLTGGRGNTKAGKGKDAKVLTGDPRPAIDSVSSYVRSGTMMAVIGASGAGKSTLLDMLARRYNKGRIEGDMYVNGSKISDNDFKEVSGYVPQEDIFVATQTAYEALLFIADLKLPAKTSREVKERLIRTLAKDAGLANQLQTRIGGMIQGGMRLKGLSGGEKRRLALVACAISSPSIMFFDEPTSGLDAYAALKIMQKAADWAARGRIVICTIHQPRTQIWDLFDECLILGSGGRQVFTGPVSKVPTWFEGMGYPVPPNTSIPDFVLDLLNVSFLDPAPTEKEEKQQEVKEGEEEQEMMPSVTSTKKPVPPVHIDVAASTAAYRESSHYKDIIKQIDAVVVQVTKGQVEPFKVEKHEVSWFRAFPILFKRNGLNYIRNPGNLAARLVMLVAIAVITGYAFWDITGNVEGRDYIQLNLYINRILSSLFFSVIVLTLLPFTSISLFLMDRQFFHKESRAKLYPDSVYFVSNVLLELIVNTVIGVTYAVINYFMQGYGKEDPYAPFNFLHFLRNVALTVAVAIVGCMQSIMFSLLSPNQDIAVVLDMSYVALALLTAGFMVQPDILTKNSVILGVIQYTSTLRYSWRALLANELHGITFPTTDNWEQPGVLLTAEYLLAKDTLDINGLNVDQDAYMLLVFFAIFTLASFMALKYLYRE